MAAVFTALFAVGVAHEGIAKPLPPGSLDTKPRLVVLMVVDQLRADAINRNRKRLLPAGTATKPGGIAWLLNNGAYFPQAEYDTSHAMTGPGHATILTGAYPYRHGIVLNTWWRTDGKGQGRKQYCVADPRSPVVGGKARSRHRGISPAHLRGTTLGDALKNSGIASKVVTVAIKDRAAVLLGGHRADLALWMEKATHRWVSSRHYIRRGGLPAWVESLNKRNAAAGAKKGPWRALGKAAGSSMPADPSRLGATAGGHSAIWSPVGDRFTTEAAIAALRNTGLGQDSATDILAVSFSAHDIVAHEYGHNAREMEEMLVSADRSIAAVLQAVASLVPGGLAASLVVLTGDHGGPAGRDYVAKTRIPSGYTTDQALREHAEKAVDARYGRSPTGRWIAHSIKYELFLDQAALRRGNADPAVVEKLVAAALARHPSIERVLTRSQAMAGAWLPGRFGVQTQHGWHPLRSGDVVAIPRPYFTPPTDLVVHFTGYSYDRHVPLIFAGRHVRRGVYANRAEAIDIAPTLAFLTGVIPPALSEGRVLDEMLGGASPGKSKRRRRKR